MWSVAGLASVLDLVDSISCLAVAFKRLAYHADIALEKIAWQNLHAMACFLTGASSG
jgi:hypothetical protein